MDSKFECKGDERKVCDRLVFLYQAGTVYGVLAGFFLFGMYLVATASFWTENNFLGIFYVLATTLVVLWLTTSKAEEHNQEPPPQKDILRRYAVAELVSASIVGGGIGIAMFFIYIGALPQGEHINPVTVVGMLWLSIVGVTFGVASLWDFWRYKRTPAQPTPWVGGAGGISM